MEAPRAITLTETGSAQITENQRVIDTTKERARAAKWGITDLDRKYGLHELASGNVLFAATGVTDGHLLEGVKRQGKTAKTHSIVMRSLSGTVRTIEATHNFNFKKGFEFR